MKLTALDWETLGIKQDTRVISVGAVTFNLYGPADFKIFDTAISIIGQENRSYSQSTIDWWKKQSDAAKAASFETSKTNQMPIKNALKQLISFIQSTESQGILGNGINFDNAILKNLCLEHNMPYPTPYWADHDLRTMKLMANTDKLPWPDDLVPHRGRDDAIYEAMCARHYWKTLHG